MSGTSTDPFAGAVPVKAASPPHATSDPFAAAVPVVDHRSDPFAAAVAVRPPKTASGEYHAEGNAAPLDDNGPSLAQRGAVAINRGLWGGMADLSKTVGFMEEHLGNFLIPGSEPKGGAFGAPAAKTFESWEVPELAPPKTIAGKATNIAGSVAGSLPSGAADWFFGIPFAAAHGWHTAEEQAAEQGKTATTEEKVRYALTEGLTRGLLGKIASLPIGRITKALIFAGGAGGESAIEGQDTQSSILNGGVSGLLGLIIPELNYEEKAQIRAAQQAVANGNGAGAMAHLRPVLMAHEEQIAKAARQVTEQLPKEPEGAPPGTPQIKKETAKSGPPKGSAPEKPTKPPGRDLVPAGKDVMASDEQVSGTPQKPPQAPINKKLTPLERSVVEKKVGADLAIRITQREYTDALIRQRMSQFETAFRGMPDDERVQMMADYQRGGTTAVPEPYRPMFDGVQKMMSDLYESAHNLGMEYEFRKNYLPGLWRNQAKATTFFDRLFGEGPGERGGSPGSGKGYFTREKVFGDYMEGVGAGLQPKTTNVAVLAAWRAEAQARALSKVLAMQDLVEGQLAVKIADLTAAGIDWKPGSPFGPIPSEYAGAEILDVGGKRYAVQPDAARMFKWAFHLDGANLENLIGVDKDGTLVRAAGTLGRAWMTTRNVFIPMKLAFSGFHALHVLGIDTVQPIAAALTEGLNGRLSFGGFLRAMKDINSRGSYAYGKHLQELFHRPYEALNQDERTLLNVMIAGGFNPAAPGIYEVRATEMIRRTLNDEIPTLFQQVRAGQISKIAASWGVTAEYMKVALGQFAKATEAIQGPMFHDWIPSVKAAAYMNQASLFISTHPDLLDGTPEATERLRQGLRDITQSIDNRFGMMQMDKLFMPNALKNGLMGTMLSVGWNLGFLREFIWAPGASTGPIPDTVKMIRDATPWLRRPGARAELTHRTVYAASYVAQAMMVIGIANYLSTGKGPDGANYFIYLRLPDGTKLNTMFFTREFAAFYYHLKEQGLLGGAWDWVINKVNPMSQSLLETLENRDFYGQQVYDINAPLWEQIAQASEHMLSGSTVPISAQAYAQGKTQTPSQLALSLAGFTKAPGYVEQPGPVGQIQNAYAATHQGETIAYGDLPKHKLLQNARAHYKEYLATGDQQQYQEFLTAISQYENLYPYSLGRGGATLKREIRSWAYPQAALEFQELDSETQLRLLRSWDEKSRETYMKYAHPDVRAAFGQ